MALFYNFIRILCDVLILALIIRAVLSWFPIANRGNAIVAIVFQVTEPVLAPIRRFLPTMGCIDFSPLVAFFVLQLIRSAVS